MTTAHLQARDKTIRPEAALLPSQRRCLVSGEVKPKSALVRFVLDPAGQVTPDIQEKLPGRGLWVSADRAAITEACGKKLFARAAKTQAKIPVDLVDQVERLLRRRCLDLLGLARSAGAVVVREPMVLEASANGALVGLLWAMDAGNDIRRKLANAHTLSNAFPREDLGAALGRESCAVVGLRPHVLTEKLAAELARWHGVASPKTSLNDSNLKQ